jgi:ectoine hydroxylase-related dioxygenase (phytanoyl-CoA dioxygenase family)
MNTTGRPSTSSLSGEYPLTREQITMFQQDGFLLLRAVASTDEVAEFRPLIQSAVREKFSEKDDSGTSRTYGKYFGQVTNIWRRDEVLKPFVFARRFAGIAAALMGVPGVRLYHDQALFKPAGGPGTPWHQDHFYWPLDTMHSITMWMPLVDAPRESGTMSFAAGSHRKGSLLDISISDESHEQFEKLIARESLPVVDHALLAGDATFHSGWTVHSAHANNTPRTREVMTVIYFADGTRLMEPDSSYRRADLEAFHPGQKPGELAASPLNPLLFP